MCCVLCGFPADRNAMLPTYAGRRHTKIDLMTNQGEITVANIDYGPFTVIFCSLCERDTVICPKCGNNCCNGGHGEVDGVECDLCPDAYEYQRVELDGSFPCY